MSLPLIIRSEAERDMEEASTWYGDQRDRNGQTIVEAFDKAFALISEHPKAFPVVYRKARRYVMDRFPYLIFYVVTDDAVEVVCVAHGSRHPRIWKHRVTE